MNESGAEHITLTMIICTEHIFSNQQNFNIAEAAAVLQFSFRGVKEGNNENETHCLPSEAAAEYKLQL